MAKKLIGLGVVPALLFSFTASAAPTLWHMFATSSGGGTTYRVSTEGNVYSIESPTGYEHVRLADPDFPGVVISTEGTVLCWSPLNVGEQTAHDLSSDGPDGGFLPAVYSLAAPWTVTQRTADRALQLKQVFTFNATSKSLNIVMTIKNLTGSTINNIVLNRVVHPIVDGAGTKGFASRLDNWHSATHDAAFAWNDPADFGPKAHGLVLRHLTQSTGWGHYGLHPHNELDCHSTGYYSPFQGSSPLMMHYFYPSLAAGASKSVTIQYMRD